MNKHIQFRKVRLVYTDHGTGPVVVLLHGYLERGLIWDPFTQLFPDGYRFIVPDLPGHGASESWGKMHTMDQLAEAVRAILDEEGIEKVFLAGHSMGGYVTMAFAALYPERLFGYSLVHSTPFADTEEKRENRDREISLVLCGKKRQIIQVNIPKAFSRDNLEKMSVQVERARKIALECPDQGIIALLNGMKARPDRTGLLKNPELRLLLIGGMKDNYIPVEVFEKLVRLAPHASVLRLEQSGHMGFVEEPQLVVRAFMDFISAGGGG